MPFTPDSLEDILVRFAYHSNAIEDSTIFLPDTVSIILESTLSSGHRSSREF